MAVQIEGFSADQLASFRQYQRQSFAVLEKVHQGLEPGLTEIEVARRIRKAFHELGVHRYFHVPVALFGERTTYPGDFGNFGALPTDTRLERGMPVILDAAPVFHGYTVDTSLARPFGGNPIQDELLCTLMPLREKIYSAVCAGIRVRDIVLEVDAQIKALGFENCHRKHIAAVLGHRVTRVDTGWLSRRRVWGLSAQTVGWFVNASLRARRRGDDSSPNWNHRRESDHAPTSGLWAVEPHIARDGVGAKFEEILVVQDGQVWWLDDDLPHHKVW